MVIMVFGLPGSGKSYFAARLAGRIGAEHLSSDRIRKSLSASPEYSPESKAAIYEAMRDRMSEAVQAGRHVVLDATFYREKLRKMFLDRASELGTAIALIGITAGEETIRARVSRPRPDSDADYAVYLKVREAFEPVAEPHLTLRSDGTGVEEMIDRAVAWLSEKEAL